MTGVIVHEWIEPHGGAENVVAEFAARFPDAPIVCAWDDTGGRFAPGRTVETWLARTPLRRSKVAALPFMLPTWRRLPGHDPDWLLCSSHLFAHHARVASSPDVPKFAFVHTPARYLWVPELDGRGDSVAARLAARPLTRIDRRRAQEPTGIAAVSEYIARRIEATWGRESTVIHPPVNVAAFDDAPVLSEADAEVASALPSAFVLGASRLVPYKRVDAAIIAGEAAQLPVVIAGDGPDRARLTALAERARVPVTLLGRTSDALLRELYRRATVYVFAPIEDFGIMPVEAMAAGTPVVARDIGGASETVVDGVTGALVSGLDSARLGEAVWRAADASPHDCRARAAEFDGRTFGTRVAAWMAGLGAVVDSDDPSSDARGRSIGDGEHLPPDAS
ncbi:glycosyltransferase [Demequina muriae]|uniref:D-inositol 3-phosphate glycosyltransferase n=1 Tax=Demequina muriae TaxID=3051664 RepID=A0ABT8GJZ9_9MICO|nr:glycosyltransferase [Demequina sp. EGI L300058]MDN4481765.1 glycosyltransferase [Demequina sp. EGI L300058]